MRKRNSLLWILPLALLAQACGSDVSVEEHQRKKLQENLALYESVAGNYSGIVTSMKDGKVMGALELSLRAEVQNNPSQGGDTAIGSPKLVGTMRFLDQYVINVTAENSFYDPASGFYSGEVKISRSGSSGQGAPGQGQGAPGQGQGQPPGGQETVTVTGNLSGGAFSSGRIVSQNFPEFGGTFTLVRNNPLSLPEQLERARPGGNSGGGTVVEDFWGETKFLPTAQRKDEISKRLQIVILQPSRGTSEDLLNLLSPLRSVDVSMNYGANTQILFPSVSLDLRQGYLTGVTRIDGNENLRITLDCRVEGASGARALNCNHITTGRGLVARSVVREPRAGEDPKLPEDDESSRRGVTVNFTGTGRLSPEEKPRKIKLSATLPARSQADDILELFFSPTERTLQVSFLFSDSVSQNFPAARWDVVNGQLEGTKSNDGSGNGYFAQFRCESFAFDKQRDLRRPFACEYWTNRSPLIRVEFAHPFN